MRVEIENVHSADQECAYIKVKDLTDNVEQAIKLLEGEKQNILVNKDGETYLLEMSKIYYIESVDNKCFVYTKLGCYETKNKLYELESILDFRFFRCSKSMICNSKKIKSVKSEYNSKLNAILLNDEVIVINRSYVKELKKRLGI